MPSQPTMTKAQTAAITVFWVAMAYPVPITATKNAHPQVVVILHFDDIDSTRVAMRMLFS